ncbi:MAG: phosphatidylglycerophosphatase [Candidatus Sulfotelmatobacter sp.]|nr:phosphatidylglycerophosphatase [Candidatus Sulfotelmatobacter sp.]
MKELSEIARPETESSAGVSRAVAGASRGTPPWATLVGTFLGLGRMRPGPGTWASATTVLLWAALAYYLAPSLRMPVAIGLAALVTLIGIPAATQIARGSGIKDPQFVVIDEVAGQLVALIAVPLAWKSFLASFILFRVFDIVKPPPVRQLEAIPEGAGIVLDDVAAGLYALVVMHLFLRFGLLK